MSIQCFFLKGQIRIVQTCLYQVCIVYIRDTAQVKKMPLWQLDFAKCSETVTWKNVKEVCVQDMWCLQNLVTTLSLALGLYTFWMEGRSALIILSVDLIHHCSLDPTCFVDKPNSAMMDQHRSNCSDGEWFSFVLNEKAPGSSDYTSSPPSVCMHTHYCPGSIP